MQINETTDLAPDSEVDIAYEDDSKSGDDISLVSDTEHHSVIDDDDDDDDVSVTEIDLMLPKKRRKLDRRGQGSKSQKGLGLVSYRDNIPEEEFQKMLRGEILPWDIIKEEDDKQITNISGSTTMKDDSHGSRDLSNDNKLIALILTPTRELALQVQSHIKAVAKYTKIKVTYSSCFL